MKTRILVSALLIPFLIAAGMAPSPEDAVAQGRDAAVQGAAAACDVGQDGGLERRGLRDQVGGNAREVAHDIGGVALHVAVLIRP